MSTTLAAALLLWAVSASAPATLKRATGAMVEVTNGQETYWHEKGIAPDDVGAVVAYLRRVGESKPEIVRVPGRAGTFLASDFGGKTGEDFGRCLFLLQSAKGGVRELARTRGAGDAYSLTPVVFRGGGRTIVLAELATEYSWGLRVYEIAGSSIHELGSIDAGVQGDLGEEDPTPFAKVSLERGRVVVRFDSDLVVGTGKEGAPVAKKPVVFRQDDGGFALVKAPARSKARR
ncbi:MAG TPA: hypothetical protein VFL83_03710 [Anaeromyxobacter sp.]|nr:hypothetical protein [Anaeromyxobacter sp.]